MREMVFRERHEKVAHLEAFTQILGRLFNLDSDRAFGHIVRVYAGEVFQETYDADLLKQKMDAIRRAQKRIRSVRLERERQLTKLDRLGEYYDREFGPDLIPKKGGLKPPTAKPGTTKPVQPMRPIKDPG
jgi:DUF438 domain-containing protein